MTKISDEYLQVLVKRIAEEIHLENYDYNKQCFSDIGQNYFGLIFPLRLSGEIWKKGVNISMVLKLAPTDERYRVSGAINLMFSREIFVYTKLFRKFRNLQHKLVFQFQYVIPECYYVCRDYCNEVIAMENMCEKDYKPFTKSMFLNKEHIEVALVSLAQFHAMSFILKKNDEQFYKEAENNCVPLTEKTNKRFMEILLNRLEKALDKFQNTEYTHLLEVLKRNYVTLVEATSTSVKRVCLCHGDIWKENILFQYKDNIPISSCIIDYQTTRISSPAYDVLFLIMTSTSSDLRKKYLTQLLVTYYQTFEKTLSSVNINSKEEYSKDMFEYDLAVVGPACFIIANTAMWLASGLQTEGHIKSKIILETDSKKFEAEENYKSIIKGMIDDLRLFGFFKVTVD